MKRIIIGILTAVFLIVGNGIVRAEERTEVEAGVKFWYNEWESEDPFFGTITSDFTMLIGPAVSVKFPNQIFLDGSFLFSTADYKFSEVTGTAKWSREDLEAAIGYMIVDEFGLLAGYKDIWLKEQATGDKENLYGPMIGAVVRLPVNAAFSFYGNFDYLFTRFKLESALETFTEDSPGWIVEVGVKYAFTGDFSGSLGYKYETTEGQDTDVRDTFTGLTLAAMFVF